jgi:hypothetical protein
MLLRPPLAASKQLPITGITLSPGDIEEAVNERCDEFTLHMNITDYVRLVCRHAAAVAHDQAMPMRARTDTIDSMITWTRQ